MTTRTSSQPHGVPLPSLSDEAAVEIYLFVEDLFRLIESQYGDQIARHLDEISPHNLVDPDFGTPLDEPPF